MPRSSLRRGGTRWRLLPAIALAWAVAILPTAGEARDTVPAVRHTVVMDGTQYEPATLTVKRGETVVWINKDPFPHTATAPGVFDSHSIAAGKSWKYKARRAGEFPYVCTLHPTMKGMLRVE
ncbi:cupredoxin family copper-binding protein [Dechloromonas sp. XY25]|uniref:Cupredoxin family copper-binding protein n=1 Tax=Dechloromonas hankyongensis TaxID=2908002 RepID=A0ABS9K295_9RHOO|nr:cupredoxin family copper-binding protein [Dechloromonas hankyongensis]MCG2577251.1 cupredoxin family copper-binding protein [Dechloromonas hankyongensis]